MDTVWLTYDELAAALRISPDSARRRAGRNKQWPRRPGNDGRVRIGIPAETLPTDVQPDVHPGVGLDVGLDVGTDADPDVGRTLAALEAHITTLKEALAKAEFIAERERDRADQLEHDLVEARTKASRVDGLEALLEAAQAERTRWHEAAMARRWWPWRRAG
jgi:hypothetical protein